MTSMIVAQITDTHLMSPGKGGAKSKLRRAALERCVADIRSLDPKPDVVIHTGDMTQHAKRKEYAQAFEILEPLGISFFAVPGNRDDGRKMVDAFDFPVRDLIGEHTPVLYAVEDFAVRLVAVDSRSFEANKGNFTEERLQQLDALLDERPDAPTAIFLHHPPFRVISPTDDYQYVTDAAPAAFAATIAKHPQIAHVFCGHSHRFGRAQVGGRTATTMPSVAVDVRQGDYPKRLKKTPIYLLHSWSETGRFDSFARITDGL